MTKPTIPQGTRDFSAEIVRKRNYIISTIRNVFELHGFEPLETPAMENLETLMGKYGEEGDKLIFKILNNGLNDPKNLEKANTGFQKLLEGKSTQELTERALKYDLTIPFARFVAMNHGQLTFPYKRYQIQQVWRADRPQKGRYREFTQCDADIVGSISLLNETELANIYHDVFQKLGLQEYTLRINSRKLLVALASLCGGIHKMTDISTAIDKLDKVSLGQVKEELKTKGFNETQLGIIENYLNINGSNQEKLTAVKELFGADEHAKKGIEELNTVSSQTENLNISIDLTLARGLNYYTGIIFEAKAPANIKMGSIGGGGRYDDLTGLFGVPGIPGVGISFGLDRIYDVMEELNLFPAELQISTQVLLFNMGPAEGLYALKIARQLRSNNIACEVYPETVKLDKQFKYATKKNIPYVIIIGSNEIANHFALVKTLSSGEQQNVPINELTLFFSDKIINRVTK